MSPQTPEHELQEYYDEDNGPTILTVTVSVTSVALCFVVARMTSRYLALRKLSIDDYLVILSAILSVAYICLTAAAIHFGGGKHAVALEPEDLSRSVLLINVAFVPGALSFTIPKFAVVILLTKILDPGPLHRRILLVISVAYGLSVVGLLVVNFVQCSPPAVQWGKAEGTCWSRQVITIYSLVVTVLSASFDIYLATYPTLVLLQLSMHWKKKLALSFSLGFGYCAAAVALYKCMYLGKLREVEDFTYTSDSIVIWTNIEANCVVIGACIPTLYPLLKKVFGSRVLGGTAPAASLPTLHVEEVPAAPQRRRANVLAALHPAAVAAHIGLAFGLKRESCSAVPSDTRPIASLGSSRT